MQTGPQNSIVARYKTPNLISAFITASAGVTAFAVADVVAVGTEDRLRLPAPEVAVAGDSLALGKTVVQVHPFAEQVGSNVRPAASVTCGKSVSLTYSDGSWIFSDMCYSPPSSWPTALRIARFTAVLAI
jgi:hypothetical protein